ncbi:MAG: TlyA family RNA methyltransferase [Pseudomonadota bacterium]
MDQALVALGLAPSRARAQAMLEAGVVTVEGVVTRKPALKIGDQAVAVTGAANPWVSRAALKLVHALDHFGLEPQGVAADLGASTGGFTQVLLARGAAQVIAIDVGHGQMHDDVARDARVELREGVNARHIGPADLPRLDWVVSDLSFISVTKALGPTLAAAHPGAQLVCLVKPQFEVGPAEVGKGGIVRSGAARANALATVQSWVEGQGWRVDGTTQSPITGGDGNIEYLLSATRG